MDLGCFPFDYGTCLSQSDSCKPIIRHSEFNKLRYAVKPPVLVEEQCIRAEAVPEGAVDCIEERMPA